MTYRALQQWFRYIVDGEEIESSTMAWMHPPIVPKQPVPVLTMDQLRALLTSCKSNAVLDGIHVLGTGRRGLALPFGQKTGVALGRYLRVRARD